MKDLRKRGEFAGWNAGASRLSGLLTVLQAEAKQVTPKCPVVWAILGIFFWLAVRFWEPGEAKKG